MKWRRGASYLGWFGQGEEVAGVVFVMDISWSWLRLQWRGKRVYYLYHYGD